LEGRVTMTDAAIDQDEGYSLAKLRRQFTDYIGTKSDEIKEQREARHYYHGDQWTSDERATLQKRKQPVVTWNRIARKIDGIVGLLERLRQDPKAYPRTPKQQDGADLSTAVLRYVLDAQEWTPKSSESARHGATEGLAGVALELVEGDNGDPDIGLSEVDNDCFFYDPRSFRADFSDARYMGLYRWLDEDQAKQQFPDKEVEIENLLSTGGEFDSDANRDRATKWANTNARQVKVVEHWYRKGGEWRYCYYCGDTVLAAGVSPFYDEKGKTICRFVMFSAAVDHDGDRYGFFRNLKSPQDEINHRRSKALYENLGRRIIAQRGMFTDIEATRREATRADGVVEWEPINNDGPKFDDAKSAEMIRSQLELMGEAKEEIDNFSFNPSLVGTGVKDMSGRAINLQQQAGIAELGPFLVAYKGWKLRVYRAIWCAVQRYWKAERWVRVTDDDGLAQFIQVNGVEIDRMTGQPTTVNALGSLDVDIILDEGPDTINMQADAYEALTSMPPQFVMQFPEIFLELAPLPESVKKKLRDKMAAQQQNPMAQQQAQIQLAGAEAEVEKTKSETAKNLAQAHQSMQPDMPDMLAHPQADGPKPPSISIAFKDLPPQAQSAALAEAGILIPPDVLAAHAERQAAQQAAMKAASRSQQQRQAA